MLTHALRDVGEPKWSRGERQGGLTLGRREGELDADFTLLASHETEEDRHNIFRCLKVSQTCFWDSLGCVTLIGQPSAGVQA